ncbi:hypothetical protein ACTFIR_003386 [Dictyostelium discoideum]
MEDHNEILFWKVFRNKFLFLYILGDLETTQWVDYRYQTPSQENIYLNNNINNDYGYEFNDDNINDIKSFNNKYLYTINYFLEKENGLQEFKLELEKNKLERTKIDRIGIVKFLYKMITVFTAISVNTVETCIMFKEILQTIGTLKRKKLIEFDLLSIVFNNRINPQPNLEILNILINEPFSFIISDSLLLKVFENLNNTHHPSINSYKPQFSFLSLISSYNYLQKQYQQPQQQQQPQQYLNYKNLLPLEQQELQFQQQQQKMPQQKKKQEQEQEQLIQQLQQQQVQNQQPFLQEEQLQIVLQQIKQQQEQDNQQENQDQQQKIVLEKQTEFLIKQMRSYSILSNPSPLHFLIKNKDLSMIPIEIKKELIRLAYEKIESCQELFEIISNNSNIFDLSTFSPDNKLELYSLLKLKSIKSKITLISMKLFKEYQKKSQITDQSTNQSIDIVENIINYNNNDNNDNNNNCFNDNEENKIKEIHKQLAKQDFNKFYQNYLDQYKEPIKELSNNTQILMLLNWMLLSFNTNSFKSLVSLYNNGDNNNNNNNNENNIDIDIDIDCKSINDLIKNQLLFKKLELRYKTFKWDASFNEFYEFVEFYISLDERYFSNKDLDYTIKSFIFSNVKDSESYEKLINLLKSTNRWDNRFKDILPNKWNHLLNLKSFQILIKDKETIDWFFDNIENQSLDDLFYQFNERSSSFQFQTYQLVQYAMERSLEVNNPKFQFLSPPLPNVASNQDYIRYLQWLYKFPYNEAIKTQDYEAVIQIDSIVDINSIPYFCLETADQIVKFSNYLEKTNFAKLDTPQNFFRYVNHITKTSSSLSESSSSSSNDYLEILKVKINFNQHIDETFKCLVRAIDYGFSHVFKLVFHNSYNLIESNLEKFKEKWNEFKNNYHFIVFENKRTKPILFKSSSANIIPLIECIEIFIDLYKRNYTSSNNNSGHYLLVLEDIINFMFKRLISKDGIVIERVRYIYRLIQIANIPIHHTIYHSIHYLNIKSQYFTKYLMEFPFIISVFNDQPVNDKKHYFEDKDYKFDGYDIRKYLNPNYFTFNLIFGKGVFGNRGMNHNELMDSLIERISILPSNTLSLLPPSSNASFSNLLYNINDSLNSNLLYFLNIKRYDLFLKHLQLIQQLLNDSSNQTVGSAIQLTFSNNSNNSSNSGSSYNNCPSCKELENGRVFYYSLKVFENTLNSSMDSKSFEKFFKFCSCQSVAKLIVNQKVSNRESLLKNFNIINHILIFHNNNNNNNNNSQEKSNIQTKIKDFWNKSLLNANESLIFKYQSLFTNIDSLLKLTDLNCVDNLTKRLDLSNHSVIPFCELLLNNLYPNFKIESVVI